MNPEKALNLSYTMPAFFTYFFTGKDNYRDLNPFYKRRRNNEQALKLHPLKRHPKDITIAFRWTMLIAATFFVTGCATNRKRGCNCPQVGEIPYPAQPHPIQTHG